MKYLAAILAVFLVSACSGMRTSGGNSSGTSNSSDYLNWRSDGAASWPSMQRHNNPSDLYFGG